MNEESLHRSRQEREQRIAVREGPERHPSDRRTTRHLAQSRRQTASCQPVREVEHIPAEELIAADPGEEYSATRRAHDGAQSVVARIYVQIATRLVGTRRCEAF